MKYLFLLAALGLGSFQAQASDRVIFQCTLEDGNQLMVERNPEKDEFTLTHGPETNAPTLTIRKLGNNLGTAVQLSGAEGALNRELYVTDGDYFYDVGYTDQRGVKLGYFQVMVAGTEQSYQTCKKDTLHSSFDDYELFSNLTTVD